MAEVDLTDINVDQILYEVVGARTHQQLGLFFAYTDLLPDNVTKAQIKGLIADVENRMKWAVKEAIVKMVDQFNDEDGDDDDDE